MALPCAKKCVFTAQQVIDLVYNNRIEGFDIYSIEPLPVWWYQIFFVYTAAKALIPARMYAHIRDDILESSLLSSWERALDIMLRLCRLSSSAQRCLAALEVLNEKIAHQNKHGRMTGSPNPEVAMGVDQDGGKLSLTEGPLMVPSAPTMPVPAPYAAHGMDLLSYMPTFEQDTTWLDSISLPTDLLSVGYGELSEMYSAGL